MYYLHIKLCGERAVDAEEYLISVGYSLLFVILLLITS